MAHDAKPLPPRQNVARDNAEARRLDRTYTGNAVNAHTDALDNELHKDATELDAAYADSSTQARKNQKGGRASS